MRAQITCTAVAVAVWTGATSWANPPGDPISLTRESPSVTNFYSYPAYIYGDLGDKQGFDAEPLIGPILLRTAMDYGLGLFDNDSGHSAGEEDPTVAPVLYFSISEESMGFSGTVMRHQYNRNQQAGDRYVTAGWLTRSPTQTLTSGLPALRPMTEPLLSVNQSKYNLIPSIDWPFENQYIPVSGTHRQDDIDALEIDDLNPAHDPMYFTLDGSSPTLATLSASPDDILIANGTSVSVFAYGSTMGLPDGYLVDALAVWDRGTEGTLDPGVDVAIFSLGTVAANLLGFSGADVFVTDFTGRFLLYLDHEELRLLATDELDALDVELAEWEDFEGWVIPEPGAGFMLLCAAMSLAFQRRPSAKSRAEARVL